ncbi:hypothetical protein DPMN_166918 [Dreissena polymorpha]|uniref:Uncharacterized protein n=1 Tax=Dreissena polymorpha TaxID=45954 RepID=A0A9D4EXU7_DREPO|nr:hypothetical protein DPMN_166918 [Dreissena polymorpha]
MVQASADADVTIVKTAIESASTQPTILIDEDTDLLVLLCYHANMQTHDIVFMSDKNSGTTRKPKIWSVHKTKTVLGTQLCHILPALHALTGCDTNSRIFGIGKGIAFKKAKSSQFLQADFAEFKKGRHKSKKQKQVRESLWPSTADRAFLI